MRPNHAGSSCLVDTACRFDSRADSCGRTNWGICPGVLHQVTGSISGALTFAQLFRSPNPLRRVGLPTDGVTRPSRLRWPCPLVPVAPTRHLSSRLRSEVRLPPVTLTEEIRSQGALTVQTGPTCPAKGTTSQPRRRVGASPCGLDAECWGARRSGTRSRKQAGPGRQEQARASRSWLFPARTLMAGPTRGAPRSCR